MIGCPRVMLMGLILKADEIHTTPGVSRGGSGGGRITMRYGTALPHAYGHGHVLLDALVLLNVENRFLRTVIERVI